MTFKVLSLGLTLLLGAAAAQSPVVQSPVAQSPAVQSPAIPALPLSPAPSASPAVPVAAAPAPPTSALRLSAAPGTALEYATTVEIELSAFELKFVGQPGAVLSAAESAQLADLNKALSAQQPDMGKLLGSFSQRVSGKQFLKMLPPDAQGNAVVLSTVIAPPLRLGAAEAAPSGPAPAAQTAQLVQPSAPDGAAAPLGLQVQGAAQGAGPAAPGSLSSLGQNNLGLYGLRLATGETYTGLQALDLSALFGPLGEALGGADIRVRIAAQPLSLNVATTFLGPGSGGVLRYQQRSAAAPWALALDLPGQNQDGPARMTLQVQNWSAQGGLSYRADGLPQTSDSAQTVNLSLTVDRADVPLQLQAKLGFTLRLSSAPR